MKRGLKLNKIAIIVRYKIQGNYRIYKCCREANEIEKYIHTLKFVNLNHNYFMDNILKHNIFTKFAPANKGLIVIDCLHNTIIHYTNEFITGTIKGREETRELNKFYKHNRVMLDRIDYMIDMSPFNVDTYNAAFKSDGELVLKKLKSLGFKFKKDELKAWDNWYKKYTK